MDKQLSGYPSVDKPWLKYYSKESIGMPMPRCTVYEYLWRNNKDYPDETALVFFDRKITFKELFSNIDRAARAFAAIGVKEKDVVTVMLLNQPEMVYCFYALNKIGAVTCVINALSNTEEIEHYLREGKSRFFVGLDVFFEKSCAAARRCGVEKYIHVPLFYSRGIIHRAGYALKVRVPAVPDGFVQSWGDFIKGGKGRPLPETSHQSSECALIGHTTGTTGFPKGIRLSDDACNAVPAQQACRFNHHRQDSLLDLIVPFALYGLLDNIHVPLSLGLKTILVPKADPEKVDSLMAGYRPNYVASIPMYWTGMIGSKKLTDLSCLKLAASGGAGMGDEQLAALNRLLKNAHAGTEMLTGYGMSEVGSVACSQINGHAVPGSVGLPLPHNIIAAFDTETMEEKKYNEVGELCIFSPSVMLGYLENEEETGKALRLHSDGRVWMHSGDLGYVDENGDVFIRGRIKRIYLTVFNGAPYKINPNRIEEALIRNPSLSECGVVCVPEGMNTYLPVAFCVLKGDCALPRSRVEEELRAAAKADLPEFDEPAGYIFKDSLPHTGQGKIDYCLLEKEAKAVCSPR